MSAISIVQLLVADTRYLLLLQLKLRMLPECDLLLKQPSIKLRRLPPDLLHLLDEVVESLMKQLRADHSAHKPTQIMQPLTISCTVLYALMNAPTSHLEGWSNQPTGRKENI